MENIAQIEKRLWSVADTLRANSNFASNEYFLPVMGLIFLRHAYSRFQKVQSEIKETLPSRGGVKRAFTKEDFSQRTALFLPEQAQFPYLVAIPDGEDRGQKIVDAMEAIERDYPALNCVLPKQEYIELGNDDLSALLRTFNEPELEKADGDVFGRIYEYFLTQFAGDKAHDGGEFFTPPSLVQTIVNVIEPDHGNIIDPACGSGGMFVQSAHFIQRMQANPNERVTFYGMEKNPTTIRLAKMNLAVHGLEGNIAQAISYYEDPHAFLGKADFVMANPPFNVDEIDAEKIKTDPRLTFGLPGTNKKEKVPNGNYVWMSYFYSYLSAKGRAGFVMSSQSSSAGGEEAKVRQAMIKTGDVDIMIAIRSNFFYTRSVPCELWFFDKDKPKTMQDKVLMIDARQIFNKVTRKIFDFTPEQQKNISSIVWLYRGQKERFIALVAEHLTRAVQIASDMPLNNFIESAKQSVILAEAVSQSPATDNKLVAEPSALYKIEKPESAIVLLNDIKQTLQKIKSETQRVELQAKLSNLKHTESILAEMAKQAKDALKQIDQCYKNINAQKTTTDKNATKEQKETIKKFSQSIKTLDESREVLKETLKYFRTLHGHAHWLLSRFPNAELVDVEGLVKLVDRTEIEANDWSLTPGRYVGIAPEIEDEDFDFEETMTAIHDELELLNAEAEDLNEKILHNFQEIKL